MQLAIAQRILGLLLMIFSVSMLPPMLVSHFFQDGALVSFVTAFVLILTLGFIMWAPVRTVRRELRLRDGFLVVVMFWVVLGLSGAVPLALAENPHMPLVDAIFESISGLTTTGATVIVGIDSLPESILFYRQQLQWLGGMGIIVLAVAVLPMLGIGGMQLYRAETPGPVKDAKLTPRMAETAKALWYIYLGLTTACAVSYWLAGMSWFDAINHSFSTVAIGGFSTHDASLGYFNSPLIESVAVFFMLLAGVNFSLHFVTFRRMSVSHYFRDPETRFYLWNMLGVIALVVFGLVIGHSEWSFAESVRHAVFHTVSIGTTTGFTTEAYHLWPLHVPVLLLLFSFMGGCAGSTGGGMKVIRAMLLLKQGYREIIRLIHPSAQVPVKLGQQPVNDRVIDSVWGFFATYILVFVVMMIVLLGLGLDHVSAFSAVGACLNNLGPGLGEVGFNYAGLDAPMKLVLCVAMLMGRLEIFTLLVLFTPAFWRN